MIRYPLSDSCLLKLVFDLFGSSHFGLAVGRRGCEITGGQRAAADDSSRDLQDLLLWFEGRCGAVASPLRFASLLHSAPHEQSRWFPRAISRPPPTFYLFVVGRRIGNKDRGVL